MAKAKKASDAPKKKRGPKTLPISKGHVARVLAKAKKPTAVMEFSPAKREVALSTLAQGYTIVTACEAAQVSRTTFYRTKGTDTEFAAQVEEAYIAGTAYLEDVARRRGAEGYQEPVIYQGDLQWQRDPKTGELLLDERGQPLPLTTTKYSDNLLMFTLKGRDRARFGDRHSAYAMLARDDNEAEEVEMAGNITNIREVISDRLKAIGARLKLTRTVTTDTIEISDGRPGYSGNGGNGSGSR